MKLGNFIYNQYKRINSNDSQFSVDIEGQTKFLNSFPEPKDYIERSYYQYKCQQFLENSFKIILQEFASLIGLIPFLLILYLSQIRKHSTQKKFNSGVRISTGVENIVPTKLEQTFDQIETVTFGKEFFLLKKDILFIIKLLKHYCFSPYFILKNSYKIASYRAIIYRYNPKSIICSSEYSFTSSLLTVYCELNGLNHINVMHGEKLFTIKEAFFQFHKCYVWDEHYMLLFRKLRAEPMQFIVSIPPCLISKPEGNKIPKYELTYYLGGETDKEMKHIKQALLATKVNPKQICVRFHPMYLNEKKVSRIFQDFTIQHPEKCSINKSFSLTKRIVSLYSTILYQGYIMGKEIIIDDIAQKKKYDKLKKLDYIMIFKPHKIFSELILK